MTSDQQPKSRTKPSKLWSGNLLFGATMGAVFYFVVVLGVLYRLWGPQFDANGMCVKESYFIGRVMSDWVNLGTLVLFGAGISVLFARSQKLGGEWAAFDCDLLGDDPDTLLLPEDGTKARKQLRSMDEQRRSMVLMRLITSGLQRAKANWSSEDVSNAIRTKADIMQDSKESEYAIVRYFAWAIPSIGFIGTVLGIGQAMASMNTAPSDTGGGGLAQVTSNLGMAFDTTFVALVLSLILMYVYYIVQGREDELLARARDWCMEHFVLRMHIAKEEI